MIFKDVHRPLYTDDCCHFGKSGKEMVMKKIASDIIEALDEIDSGS